MDEGAEDSKVYQKIRDKLYKKFYLQRRHMLVMDKRDLVMLMKANNSEEFEIYGDKRFKLSIAVQL